MNYFTILVNDADCSCAMFVQRGPQGRYIKYDLPERTAADMMVIERPKKDDISGSTLIVPITKNATQAIFDLHDQGRMMGDFGDGAGMHPYYFSADMSINPQFERAGRPPVDFLGQEIDITPEQQVKLDHYPQYDPSVKESSRRAQAQDIPFTRMNCWAHALFLLNHIAGADLDEIDPALPKIMRAYEAHEWFEALDEKPVSRRLFQDGMPMPSLSEYQTNGGFVFYKTHIMPIFLNDAAKADWRDQAGNSVDCPMTSFNTGQRGFGIPDAARPTSEPEFGMP